MVVIIRKAVGRMNLSNNPIREPGDISPQPASRKAANLDVEWRYLYFLLDHDSTFQ